MIYHLSAVSAAKSIVFILISSFLRLQGSWQLQFNIYKSVEYFRWTSVPNWNETAAYKDEWQPKNQFTTDRTTEP